MAKKRVAAIVKIQIPAGKATPAPPVGTALGPHGIAIMDFVKAYNAATEAQVGTSTWQAAFDHNLSIILDLAMGGAYPNGVCGCTSPTSSTASGGTMSVAYVAAYSTSGSWMRRTVRVEAS